MQLEFVYKNNHKKYEIVEGANISMSYNEDLSVGTLIIRENVEIDIEPYDEVIVYGLDYIEKLYMLIDTFVCKETRNRFNDKEYTYTISIMSQTKLLENKILPSLAITPRKEDLKTEQVFENTIPEGLFDIGDTFHKDFGTDVENAGFRIKVEITNVDTGENINDYFSISTNQISFVVGITITCIKKPTCKFHIKFTLQEGKYSIMEYLQIYNDLYGQKVRTETGFINKFNFSNECWNKFYDVCPELQFNNPTFRECLTQLMMVKNCIPVVQNNVIGFIDLSEKHDLVDKDDSHIAYVETSQSSNDYVDSLHINMKNVIQEDGYVTVAESIGFRSENSSLVDTNNLYLYTQHPIYEIVKLKIKGVGQSVTSGVAITSYFSYWGNLVEDSLIYEKAKWETLDVAKELAVFDWERYKNYQNSTVYYTRGSNVIQNFGMTTRRSWMGDENICVNLLMAYYLRKHSVFPDDKIREVWENCCFEITYKTKADITAKLGKTSHQTTEREVVDNQNQNYVNAHSLGLLEYAKANRLGNKMKIYSARFPRNYSELPVVGDYYKDNEIIYKIDYQVWQNAVDATIYACPNYVMRNYFTGVQSKLRSWKIVDGNEAFSREDVIKYYLEFGYKQLNDFTSELTPASNDFILDSLGALNNSVMNVAITLAKTINSDLFLMDTIKNVSGNSLLFTFGYNDNYQLYRYISKLVFEGGMKQNMYAYVDGNGNFNNITYTLSKSFAGLHFVTLYNEEITPEQYREYKEKIQNYQREQPKFIAPATSTNYLTISKDLYKDNKEITKINTQFEFCASDDIYLGDEFIKGHKGTGIAKTDLEIKVNDSVIKPITDMTLTAISNKTVKIAISGVVSTDRVKIYNKTNSNALIEFTGDTIYLNLLKQRNKHIYERVGNDLVIKRDL